MSTGPSPTTRRFVRAAWLLLAAQLIAAIGAAAVTIWAATAVKRVIDERDMLQLRVQEIEARPAAVVAEEPVMAEEPAPMPADPVPVEETEAPSAPDVAPTPRAVTPRPAPPPLRPRPRPLRPAPTYNPPTYVPPVYQPPVADDPPISKPPVADDPPPRRPRPRVNIPLDVIFGNGSRPRRDPVTPPTRNPTNPQRPPSTSNPTRPPSTANPNNPPGIIRQVPTTTTPVRRRPRPTTDQQPEPPR